MLVVISQELKTYKLIILLRKYSLRTPLSQLLILSYRCLNLSNPINPGIFNEHFKLEMKI